MEELSVGESLISKNTWKRDFKKLKWLKRSTQTYRGIVIINLTASNIESAKQGSVHPMCPGQDKAINQAKELARAFKSFRADSTTADQIFESVKDQYCSKCASKLKNEFWNQIEAGNEN